jgi:hypothetical protein
MHRKLRHWLLILTSAFIACSSTGCERTTPEPLSAEEILNLAIERTANLTGFECSLLREGSRAFVDPEETIALRRIDGSFVAPDKLRATVRVITPGLVTEFQIISLGEDQWFTNLITGEWEVVPSAWGFYPATLFEPETGMVSVLRTDLSNLQLEGLAELDEVPGKQLYHLSAGLSGENLYYLSYGMIASDRMDVELWVEPGSFEVHRIVLAEPMPDENEPRIWTLDFWNFDRVAEIAPPDVLGIP